MMTRRKREKNTCQTWEIQVRKSDRPRNCFQGNGSFLSLVILSLSLSDISRIGKVKFSQLVQWKEDILRILVNSTIKKSPL